jgi:hypothetical protein
MWKLFLRTRNGERLDGEGDGGEKTSTNLHFPIRDNPMKSKWNINVCRVSLYSQCKRKIRQQPGRNTQTRAHTAKNKKGIHRHQPRSVEFRVRMPERMRVTFEIGVVVGAARACGGGSFRCSAPWSRKWQTSSNKWNYRTFYVSKNEPEGTGGKKPKRIKLVRGRDARCSGEFLYNCQRLGTRTGRKSRWHYTFIRRRGFTPATITSLVAPTEAITFDRSPGKFIIYRFFEVSRSPTGDPLRSPPRFHFRSHQAYWMADIRTCRCGWFYIYTIYFHLLNIAERIW